ncbi:DUF2971 domain-containing protein [Vibrio parahaemolyticus]
MKLYKYLPFTEGSKCILTQGTMKFSHHTEFNDPFDCKTTYEIEASMAYVQSRPDLFKEAGRQLNLSPAQRVGKKKQMLNGIKRSLENGSFHNGVINEVGICCLTKKTDNILMWSHYADNHKGFVVEFTVDHATENMNMEKVEEKLFGWDVEYSKNMPVITAGGNDFNAVKDVFLIKSVDWAYESEYRVLSMYKGPGIHNFDQKLISRVIAGVNMPDSDFKELKRLVEQLSSSVGTNPEVVQAKMSQTEYRIIAA